MHIHVYTLEQTEQEVYMLRCIYMHLHQCVDVSMAASQTQLFEINISKFHVSNSCLYKSIEHDEKINECRLDFHIYELL